MGREHCGRRRKCSLRAISPFPTVFSKACFPGALKGVIVWEGINSLPIKKILDVTKLKEFADDKLNFDHMKISLFNPFPNDKFQTLPNSKSLQTTILTLMKMAGRSPNV